MELWYSLDFEIKAGHTEDFLAIFRPISEASRKEPGMLQYDLQQSTKNPQRFHLIQRYASKEAVQYHMNQPYTQEGMMLMSQYLAKPYTQSDCSLLI